MSNRKKRLIVVANRLPITITVDEDGLHFKQSPGGLITALQALRNEYDLVWIGWPGDVDLGLVNKKEIEDRLHKDYKATPIFLTRRQLNRYYFGFSNKVLWPVLHYLPTYIDYDERDFRVYREVNQIFADAVLDIMKDGHPDDMIWVHDYQLMLVPEMIRREKPHAKIGFFLHTPFPSSEMFRTLPFREELLTGIMGSTLVGFHTFAYLRHFRSAMLHILGRDSEISYMDLENHRMHMGAFPISIDVEKIKETMFADQIHKDLHIVRNIKKGRRMILSVDRLDYTKGLPDRMHAYQRFLEHNPGLAREVVLVQIAVPSRTRIADYQSLKEQVEEIVMEIQDTYERETDPPIHFIYRSLPFDRLCAFYMEADVALVTPYFDGMNLVAKEFVAVKRDHGALILSEHAGAAYELGEALIINPWNPDQISAALSQALDMPPEEQRRRMQAMYTKIERNDVHFWSNYFLRELRNATESEDQSHNTLPLNAEKTVELRDSFRKAKSRLLLLDYDGTLVNITNLPINARPDQELLELLQKLSELPNTDVAVVTGRSKTDITGWLGELPIGFSTEHGLWMKWPDETTWHRMVPEDHNHTWYNSVKDLLEQFNLSTPGSFTEEKEASLAWHYRTADPTQGRWKARELIVNLRNVLANMPLEVISGKAVVEVRPQGVNKGNVFQRLHQMERQYEFMMAIGDDATDEHLFDALQQQEGHHFTIKVGKGVTHADYRLSGVQNVRQLLYRLLDY